MDPRHRARVVRVTPLPGSPRVRQSRPIADMDVSRLRDAADSERRTGVNTGDGSTWGAYYPGVTSRKALKRPSWSSRIAGGEYITDPLV